MYITKVLILNEHASKQKIREMGVLGAKKI
jgi:hypothetical protein